MIRTGRKQLKRAKEEFLAEFDKIPEEKKTNLLAHIIFMDFHEKSNEHWDGKISNTRMRIVAEMATKDVRRNFTGA